LRMLGAEVQVHRNDEIDVPTVETLKPTGIVISPGPGHPSEAGVTLEVITTFMGRIPILGVCLGHQAIVHALGGEVVRAKHIMHGKTSRIRVVTQQASDFRIQDSGFRIQDSGEGVKAESEARSPKSEASPEARSLFHGVTGPFEAMRYHSLVARRETLPPQLTITAESEDDHEIMGVRHRDYPLEGIQFHPESIMTIIGKRLLRNFLNGTELQS
ncbi:MAG: aminodeoxychorismate/anthranilate synthase component II, partial [Planctomycetaceae bacterium]|nr:aminodeoxychorismate/anthranilate synthase component II [Planctomycetaceae bacterium]